MFKIVNSAKGYWRVVNEDTGEPVPFMFEGDLVPGDTFLTLEEAETVLEERVQTTYFEALRDWLRSIGVCGLCSVLMASAKIEHWAGRPRFDWKAARGECMGHPCKACAWCREGTTSCPHPLNCEATAKARASEGPKAPAHPRAPETAPPTQQRAHHQQKGHAA